MINYNSISNTVVEVPIGFLYWIMEDIDCRGFKQVNIDCYEDLLKIRLEEFKQKYPQGLTGFK